MVDPSRELSLQEQYERVKAKPPPSHLTPPIEPPELLRRSVRVGRVSKSDEYKLLGTGTVHRRTVCKLAHVQLREMVVPGGPLDKSVEPQMVVH